MTGADQPVRAPAADSASRGVVRRLGWLRAAVLGANDGIVSTAALVVGVAGATTGRAAVVITGLVGVIAGAVSMALGEYVSVSSQRDGELVARSRGRLSAVITAPTDPLAAAGASAGAFTLGSLPPLAAIALTPVGLRVPVTMVVVLLALAGTGVLTARRSGADVRRSVVRLVVGGAAAMVVTYVAGWLVGTV